MNGSDPAISTDPGFSPEVRRQLSGEIAAAGGNEVFFFGTLSPEKVLVEVEVVARGDSHQVPVFLERAGHHQVLIHNHPGGDLTPSPADLSIACEAGSRGLGFFIIDSAATRVYRVVEPFDREDEVFLELGEIGSIFAPGGLLEKGIPGFEDRAGQRELALEVARAFNERRVVACEAGTGVGKSFAYLVPAILWAVRNRGRVIVSTATIALQEQLVGKDLPQLQRVLDEEFKFTLIKGRSNYICRRKAREVDERRELFAQDEEEQNWVEEILGTIPDAREGSHSELPRVPPSEVWSHFESTSDQSLKTRCRFYRECFYYNARRRSIAAHIVVVNHHLFFSDLRIRRELGATDADLVIPGYKRVIFDEAHRLEEVASQHLGARTSRQGILVRLGRLVSKGRRRGDPERGRLPYVRSVLRKQQSPPGPTLEYLAMGLLPAMKDARRAVIEVFEDVRARLEDTPLAASQGPGMLRVGDGDDALALDVIDGPLVRLREELQDLRRAVRRGWSLLLDEPFEPEETYQGCLAEFRSAVTSLDSMIGSLAEFLGPESGMLPWIEVNGGPRPNLSLQVAPVRVDRILAEALYDPQDTVVMTSATLSVDGRWDYLSDRLGWGLADSERFKGQEFHSPFDFDRQALLAIPTDGLPPDDPGFEASLADAVVRVAEAAQGRTFVLFTSHRMLRRVADRSRERLAAHGFPVLVQGTVPRSELLARFRETGNAVLFGNQTFWEGVDVPGDALSCVIIARLPFRVPTHPLERGRVEEVESRGENPFVKLSVPQAVLSLKQGAGRLIRTQEDRGVVLIADPRILTQRYGRTFLKSLPNFRRIAFGWDDLLDEVGRFFGRPRAEESKVVVEPTP